MKAHPSCSHFPWWTGASLSQENGVVSRDAGCRALSLDLLFLFYPWTTQLHAFLPIPHSGLPSFFHLPFPHFLGAMFCCVLIDLLSLDGFVQFLSFPAPWPCPVGYILFQSHPLSVWFIPLWWIRSGLQTWHQLLLLNPGYLFCLQPVTVPVCLNKEEHGADVIFLHAFNLLTSHLPPIVNCYFSSETLRHFILSVFSFSVSLCLLSLWTLECTWAHVHTHTHTQPAK